MFYGELATHSEEYQCGHSSGSVRAYDDAIRLFESLQSVKPNESFSPSQIVAMLRNAKVVWLQHCDGFGIGVSDND